MIHSRDTVWRRTEPADTWAPHPPSEAQADEWGRPRPWRSQALTKPRYPSGDIDADSGCFSRFSRRRWCSRSAASVDNRAPSRTRLYRRLRSYCAALVDLDLLHKETLSINQLPSNEKSKAKILFVACNLSTPELWRYSTIYGKT